MQKLNLTYCVSLSSLLVLFAAAGAGCSKGSGSDSTGAAGTPATTGAAGSPATTGAAGTPATTGAAGTPATTGAAGSLADAGAAGTAASTGAGGLPVATGVCAGTGTRSLTIAQGAVDDFEETAILPGWSSFNDVQPTSNAFLIAQDAPGALGTAHFGHYMGTGAKTPVMGGFGVGAIYNMAIDKTNGIYCVDVTAFDGVTFWAKAATMGAKVGVNFVVPETNMAPDGDCPLNATTCYNHPQVTVTLTTDWAQYTVPFATAHGGTGAKVNGRIQELGWLSPDSNWDFSIDEIQFYTGTPPTTAVGGNSTM